MIPEAFYVGFVRMWGCANLLGFKPSALSVEPERLSGRKKS